MADSFADRAVEHVQVLVARRKALQLQSLSGRGGWWSVVREPYTGAWQRNDEIRLDNVLTHSAVFACVTLIASDIAKLGLRLVEQDAHGIWSEVESPAFSPVLRKPNRYQTRIKFIEQWLVSKLVHGNTYVLKERDRRGVVVALYILDPTRVTPLVAQDGSVYYELKRDDLSNQPHDLPVTVPAREIIHDTMVALFHPLMGVSPIFACGLAALQGLSIQNNSSQFFSNGSHPGGVVLVPGEITEETAIRLKAQWVAGYSGDNYGKVAILSNGMKYEGTTVNAVDAQLLEQLNWTAINVCSCFHIQPYMISVGPPPPYANIEPLNLQYYSQCLQSLIENLELSLDEGLGLNDKIEGKRLGVEFDIADLIRMDSVGKTTAAQTAISSGGMSPNEARGRFLELGPVVGGDSPMAQAQYYSLAALAARDADQPFAKPAPMQLPAPVVTDEPIDPDDEEIEDEDFAEASLGALLRKALEVAA